MLLVTSFITDLLRPRKVQLVSIFMEVIDVVVLMDIVVTGFPAKISMNVKAV